MERKLLFVYGTLRRGHDAHDRMLKHASFRGVRTLPGFVHLAGGDYPCIVPGDGEVAGEVFDLGVERFADLDAYEGPDYTRQAHTLSDGTEAEVYVYTGAAPRLAAVKMASTEHRRSIALMKFLAGIAKRYGVAEHVYVVGGAVRNFIIKEPIKDIDVVIDSVALKGKDSDWFAKVVRAEIPVQTSHVTNQHGVAIITVTGDWQLDGQSLKGETIEIANARADSYPAEGSGGKPDKVDWVDIHQDAYRREFTFNCMTGDTLIPTEKGILRIDQIASRADGDHQDINLRVAGQDGPATAVGWQYSGFAPTLKVTTEWGHTFSCTHHHPVLVLRGHDHRWVQADQLEEGDLLCVPVRQMTRHQPLAFDLPDPVQPKNGARKEVRKPEGMTPELAFVIGCVVAEGSNTPKRVSFSNSDPLLISRYIECFQSVFGFLPSRNKVVERGSVRVLHGVEFVASRDGYDIYADSKAVVGWLGDLGLYCGGGKDGKSASHHKVVPWSILQADARSQWAFLAAYLEGDGSIRPDTGCITFCSASPHVRQQLQVLLGAHGILAKVKDRFVYLNATDSARLWEKVRPWMVTKGFDYTQPSARARNRYGIPADYIKGFLAGRKQDTTRALYATDEGGSRILPAVHESSRKVRRLLHDAYARGDFDGFLADLKVISPDEYAKLQRLFDLGYQYVEVAAVEDAGEQDVFDISMGAGVEPAFVANGVVVHNTLLWRMLDLAKGPDKAEIIDLTGCGLRDLQEGVMRCPKEPDQTFADDPTRMIRAIKFLTKYGLRIAPDVEAAIKKNVQKIKNVEWAAISNLLINVILGDPKTARRALLEMKRLGILDVVGEMILADEAFRGALQGWANNQKVMLLFDLMDLGVPVGTRIDFLSPGEQKRLREIAVGMHEGEAEHLVDVLRQPGKGLDQGSLIKRFGLKGPQIAGTINPAVRRVLLGDPTLLRDKAALTAAVAAEIEKGTPPGGSGGSGGKTAAAPVKIVVDVPATAAARQKFPSMTELVVAKFDQSVAMYRMFDGFELRQILATGKITGGSYSVRAERAFGASWAHDLSGVINMGNQARGKRLGDKLYLAKIDAMDMTFAHLDPQVTFDPAGPPEQVVHMDADRCYTGLGCSIMNVSVSDVDSFYRIEPNGQLTKLSDSELKVEARASPETPPVVPGITAPPTKAVLPPAPAEASPYALKPGDKFVVDKGSRGVGLGARMHGKVVSVKQDPGDNRVNVTMWFAYPRKFPDGKWTRDNLTLYATHPNRLADPSIALLNSRGDRILIRKVAFASKVASVLTTTDEKLSDGVLYKADITLDEFVHFTTEERASQIVARGKLLMNPPYKKSGIDAVTAVSTKWGRFVPEVQITHSKGPLVALFFKTSTLPDKASFGEEVVWHRDVILHDPKIVPLTAGIERLKSAPERVGEFDMVTYKPDGKFASDSSLRIIDNAGYKDITGVRRLPIARLEDPKTKAEQVLVGNADIDKHGLRLKGKDYLSDELTERLFSDEVVIEEKVDGHPVIILHGGYTFFAESLSIRHSVEYDAVPYSVGDWPDHTVVYDVLDGEVEPPYHVGQGTGKWLTRGEKETVCNMVGAPLVPLVFKGRLKPEDVPALARRISSFGTGQAEGVVIKNLKAGLFGKFVNIEFIKQLTDEDLHVHKHPMQLGVRNIRRRFIDRQGWTRDAAGKGRRLRVFDFDDTLVSSESAISVVMPDGEKITMDSATFAHFSPPDGATLDFSAFNDVKNPRKIKSNFNLLKRYAAEDESVVILTARPKGASSAVTQFLEDEGITDVRVVALASSDPEDKAKWIDQEIEDGSFEDAEFYDDSRANAAAVAQHSNRHKITVKSVHVPKPKEADYAGGVIKKTYASKDPTKAIVKYKAEGKGSDEKAKGSGGRSKWWDAQTSDFQHAYCEDHPSSKLCPGARTASTDNVRKTILRRAERRGNERVLKYAKSFVEKLRLAGAAAGLFMEQVERDFDRLEKQPEGLLKGFSDDDFKTLREVLWGAAYKKDAGALTLREAGFSDAWLRWIVQPLEVLWAHRKEFLQGPVDDALDSILKDLAPQLVKQLIRVEVDSEIDEFIRGAQAAKEGHPFDHSATESTQQGYAWGRAHPDEVSNDLPAALKRQLIRNGLHILQGRITEEVVLHTLRKVWHALNPVNTVKAIIAAVRKHGWKVGLGIALVEILEHAVVPSVVVWLTGDPKYTALGGLPLSEIAYAVVLRALGRVPDEVDKPSAAGHLQWFESVYGPVRLALISARPQAKRVALRYFALSATQNQAPRVKCHPARNLRL